MSRSLRNRRFSIALLAILVSAMGTSFGSTPARIVPAKGQPLLFRRTYSRDELANSTLQRIVKTDLVLKNSGGLITATWNATFRDIRNDERFATSATGICKPRMVGGLICNFDLDRSQVILTAREKGARVVIPIDNAVLFRGHEKDGMVRPEYVLGADDANNVYFLHRK